jgi:mannose-6-phosphate isomerase-like protein (cupin superfamily)
MPKIMAAKDRFDVVFQREYTPPELGEWDAGENVLPEGGGKEYFLRANSGPRWIAGGVLSRPFIETEQCEGKFSISSIESSKKYGKTLFSRPVTFKNVDHCLCIQEGALIVSIDGGEPSTLHEGETVLIPAGKAFTLEFGSRFVRVWSFAGGDGIEALIHKAGEAYKGFVLPDEASAVDEGKFGEVCKELNVVVGDKAV